MKTLEQRNRISFGLGTVGRDMFYAFEANTLLYFLSDVLSLPVWVFAAASMVLSVMRIFDAFNDPITGLLIDNIRSPWGKFKPAILVGGVLSAIFAVLLFAGIGTGWTFVVWGALHGLAQVDERLWGARLDRLPKALRWVLTRFFINFAWVFFRAPDMTSALTMLTSAVSGGGVGIAALSAGVFESEMNAVTTLLPAAGAVAELLLPVSLLAVGTVVCLWPRTVLQKMEDFRPTRLSAVALAVLVLWAVLSFSGVTTFIYSNF